jgi:hypothetical protein
MICIPIGNAAGAFTLLMLGCVSSANATLIQFHDSSSDQHDPSTVAQCAPGYTSPPEGGNACIPNTIERRNAQEECRKDLELRYEFTSLNTQLFREMLFLCTENRIR